MPLPLLFIGIAAATGGLGVGKTIKAGIDANNAKKINKNANEIVEASTEWLNTQRMACGNSLRQLGEQKLFILNSSITEFFDTFTKIKNVDFRESEGLEELKKFHVDEKEFVELKSMVSFAGSLAGGAVAGTAGGALAAFGAYGTAQALACASTGTGTMDAGTSYEMYAVAASVIGGVSTLGGSGILSGTVIGAAIWGVLQNGLQFAGAPVAIRNIVIGIIVVVAVLLDVIVRSGIGKSKKHKNG